VASCGNFKILLPEDPDFDAYKHQWVDTTVLTVTTSGLKHSASLNYATA
jgi:hypothetical protein